MHATDGSRNDTINLASQFAHHLVNRSFLSCLICGAMFGVFGHLVRCVRCVRSISNMLQLADPRADYGRGGKSAGKDPFPDCRRDATSVPAERDDARRQQGSCPTITKRSLADGREHRPQLQVRRRPPMHRRHRSPSTRRDHRQLFPDRSAEPTTTVCATICDQPRH